MRPSGAGAYQLAELDRGNAAGHFPGYVVHKAQVPREQLISGFGVTGGAVPCPETRRSVASDSGMGTRGHARVPAALSRKAASGIRHGVSDGGGVREAPRSSEGGQGNRCTSRKDRIEAAGRAESLRSTLSACHGMDLELTYEAGLERRFRPDFRVGNRSRPIRAPETAKVVGKLQGFSWRPEPGEPSRPGSLPRSSSTKTRARPRSTSALRPR